ncbi:MAG: hypothetical protein KDD36_10945 [Flavobacteriales bacterium]|nr:hypothetical protein [Flavobacteriales bacterium]
MSIPSDRKTPTYKAIMHAVSLSLILGFSSITTGVQAQGPSDEAFRDNKKVYSNGFSFLAGIHYYRHSYVEFHLATGSQPRINPLIPERSRYGIHRLTGGLSIGYLPHFFAGPSASYMYTSGYSTGFALRLNATWLTDFKESVMIFRPDVGIQFEKRWQLLFGPNLKQGQGEFKDLIETFNLSLVYVLTRKSLMYYQ